jgi:TolB-like protein
LTSTDGERKLAAIMFTDMVGYTALGQRNESLSLALVEEQRKLIRPILTRYNGREVKTMGDAFLVEFHNALDAVRCAYDIQRATREFNIPISPESRIHLRIGLHLGDVVESHGDISGDAVNVASRIEPLSEDGGVCLTRPVYESTHNKLDVPMVSIGVKTLKNVSDPMEVYKMTLPWEQTSSTETRSYPTNRVAILPFRSMSPDPNDEFFAEGITEEIISTASGISGLSVISRTSVMGYKGTAKRVREIGKELEAGSILEGSLRKAGNRIRVTAQLIDVASDKHLWAQNYDRSLDDIFEVQSDVAKQVADALRVRILSPEKQRIEKRPTESTTAYTLYLKGRHLWNSRRLDEMKRAMECFELAVHEDPSFALGYVGQADCAILLQWYWGIDPSENLTKAKEMAEMALQLDPDLAEAHATLGFAYHEEYEHHRAEEEFRKAIGMKPSYTMAHVWYSMLLEAELRWDEALKEAEKAVELDPLTGLTIRNLGICYYLRKEFRKAVEKLRIAVELGHEGARAYLFFAYGMARMYDQMEKEGEAWARYDQDTFPGIRTLVDAYGAYLRGDKETVRRLLPELEAHPKETGTGAWDSAVLHFFLGDVDKGFEWLERAYSRRERYIVYIRSSWDLDGVRDDPRYLDLVKRLGLD